MGNAGHHRHGYATEDTGAAFLSSSGYAVLAKYRWRTPPEVVAKLSGRFGPFDLDACAGAENAVAERYIDAELDCLSGAPWNEVYRGPRAEIRSVFMNSPWATSGVSKVAREAFPGHELAPFPGTAAFAEEAWRQSQEYGLSCVCLCPNATDTKWQQGLIQRASMVLVNRRFPFLDHRGIRQASPPGGTVTLLFEGCTPCAGWRDGPEVVWGWTPGGNDS